MNIEELEQGHYDIHFDKKYEINPPNYHTKLSIQFAIEVLEELYFGNKPIENQTLIIKLLQIKLKN